MKKILVGLACIAVLLVGCSAEYENKARKTFYTTVYSGYGYLIVYDNDTKVMYYMSDSSYNRGNLTPLYNADGTLRVWEEEIG